MADIFGTPGNDFLIGTIFDDRITGGNGNDFIDGLEGNDRISGGNGDDVIFGFTGDDTINGGSGNDEVFGEDGDDRLIGSSGNDLLDGGSGIDIVDYSFLGTAITLESQGLVNKGLAGTDQINGIEIIIGAAGQANTIDGSTGTGPTSFDVDLSTNSLTVNGIPGLGDVDFTVVNFVNVTGTDSGDRIKGNFQNNIIKGDAGNDLLIGSGGNDFLDGGSGIDIADYSSLGTAISLESQGFVNKGLAGTDQINGIEIIIGAAGQANTIDGSTGTGPTSFNIDLSTNSLTVNNIPGLGDVDFTVENFVNAIGTDGDDQITGDFQDNILGGSDGNDFLDGGSGIDIADYSSLGTAISLESQGLVNKGLAGTDQINGIEIIIGAAGQANTIDGSTGTGPTSFDVNLSTNSLTVNGIPGLGNVDFTVVNFVDVIGTDANDSLTGNSQNNILEGGLGADTLTGGLGADTFVFNSLSEGIDIIQDFDFTQGDKIQVSGSGFGATSTTDFDFNVANGALSFLGTQFAQLNNIQASFGFIPSLDINIV